MRGGVGVAAKANVKEVCIMMERRNKNGFYKASCHILYMAPAALLQDRAGAGPNDPTSSRFLELNSTYVIVRLTSSINSSVIVSIIKVNILYSFVFYCV